MDLSDYGFLVDPANRLALTGHPKPKTLDELSTYHALILLGEAGMGKTAVLAAEAARTAKDEEGRVFFHADLRAYSSESLLYRRIFEHETFQAWLKGNNHLTLYLDSLDEALLRIDSIAALLAAELPQLPAERLSIRIACRTAVWPSATLEPALQNIWGEDAVGAFELAPLRRIDVIEAAGLQCIDPDQFIPSLFEASAVPFAIKPLTLNMLFDLFKREGRLPNRVSDLYRRGCLTLCEESNAGRREAKRLGTLATAQRFRVASRIATFTMLANRYAIWTGAEGAGVPEEDVTISALAGEREEGDFPAFDVAEDHIREVLDTGLFTSRGGLRMGWAHQSYAEFLAAQYLVEKDFAPETILKILLHPSGGLVPQLGVVAAWVATLSKPVRDALIATEPLILLRGDLTSWAEEDVAALTASLLKALDDRRANDLDGNIADFYGRLKHPKLAEQLQPYLADRDAYVISRRAAIRIADRCGIKELKDDLLRLALDPADDTHLRAYAISALRNCGDDAVISPLMVVARGELGADPQDEMLGYALQLLWPNHITAEELFPLLIHPNEGFFGSYSYFILYLLVPALKEADLPRALAWAKNLIAKTTHDADFKRKSLADAIFVRAWERLADDATREALVDYVQVCLAQAGELMRGTDHRAQEAFQQRLKEDIVGRATFLRALAKRKLERIDVFGYVRHGLLQPSDLPWLLSVAPGGADRNAGYSEETLCYLVEAVCSFTDPEQFERLYAAAEKWPMLWQRFIGVFEGVPLDSPECKQLRNTHFAMESFKEKKRPVLDPPPALRVANALAKFEAGAWRAFYWLNWELTLEPDSTGYWSEHSYIITDLPGWKAADALLQERIIKAAEQYLTVGKTHVAQFIGKAQARSDAAAFRAFILLKDQDPAAYTRVGQDVWEKWAPGIAYLHQELGDKVPQIQRDVYAEALRRSPARFVRAIRTLLRRERTSSAQAGKPAPTGTSFFKSRDLKDCWHSIELCEMVFAELQDPTNTEDQFAALLDVLLEAKYEPAQECVIKSLAGGKLSSDIAVSAANGLAAHEVRGAWPTIWSLISIKPEFGKAFFLRLATRYRFQESIFNTLTERELAEIYVLLQKLFPPTQDPKHEAGKAHFIGPDESIAHLRESVPRRIEAHGTPEAVAALRWVVAQLPELDWLSLNLQRAEQLMRMRTWSPLVPGEIKKLALSRKTTLVRSAEDLLRIITTALREYERQLHGPQNPVRLLWDRQGRGDTYMPVEEDALSDNVKLFLQCELADSGIIANREVEVGRLPGAPIGKRTDIKIDAIRRGSDDTHLDTLTAIIETKGCWNRGLFPALKNQLFGEYMTRLSAPVGIYLVGWFNKDKWDPADTRRHTTPDISLEDAQKRLDYEAAAIPSGFVVQAVVVDCHLPL